MKTPEERFQEITDYNISEFFDLVYSFIKDNYDKIYNYYSGDSTVDNTIFNTLDGLIKQSNIIAGMFQNNVSNLSDNIEFWDLLTDFEEAQLKLLSIKNTAKWIGSSFSRGYENKTNSVRILKQGETLEAVAAKYEYLNPNDDWAELAIKNNISESDYNFSGGSMLNVTFKNTKSPITSVVDIMVGENILGKDFDKELKFESDDFKILTPIETSRQSVEIKLNLTKGDISEDINIGMTKMQGGNVETFLQYPIVFRELTNIFSQDDTFNGIAVLDVRNIKGAVVIDLEIKAKIAEAGIQKEYSL